MIEQSRGMKVLYTVFLVAMTLHTVLLLADRFATKESCNCKKKENG